MAIATILILLLPVLYALSYGPYARIYPHSDPPWAETFYFPLRWCQGYSVTARDLMQWYVRFWVPAEPQADPFE